MSKLKRLITIITQWKLGVDRKLFIIRTKELWIEAQIQLQTHTQLLRHPFQTPNGCTPSSHVHCSLLGSHIFMNAVAGCITISSCAWNVGDKPRQKSQVSPPFSLLAHTRRIQSFLKSQKHLFRQILGTSCQIRVLKLIAVPDAYYISRNWL